MRLSLCSVPLFCAALLLALSASAPAARPTTQALVDEIGTWDGVTESAELTRPYEDPIQQKIPFGMRSYDLAPWRAYMDTWPATRYLRMPGVVFNVAPEEAPATAQMLFEAGIRTARLEIGWGNLDYDDPTQLKNETQVRALLKALRDRRIRPLILLNANAGAPCPHKSLKVQLLERADVGATSLKLDRTDGIILHHTGLGGQAYMMGFPLIVGIDEMTHVVQLSAPLNKAVEAGALDLWTLRYQPFAGAVFADGKLNPAAQESLDGWQQYVGTITSLVAKEVGTATNAGFDIEVWNEYTFGSEFLNANEYYQPPRTFSKPLSYSKHGLTRQGPEIILPITIDYVNDPANQLPGVKVLSGFSNQRPWDNGSDLWPGQAGFSRHYYTGVKPFGEFNGIDGLLAPGNDPLRQPLVDALGNPEGKRDPGEPGKVLPGSFFSPTLPISMPESWHFGYKTEFITRDLQPFPGPFPQHGRYTNPGDGRQAEVWQTEFNAWRMPWADALVKDHGAARDDPRFAQLMHHVGAKALLRSFVFHSHKGMETMTIYSAKEKDDGFAVIPEAFFKTLTEEKFQLTDRVRAEAGPQLASLQRVDALMRSCNPAVDVARPLSVSRLVEHRPRLVYRGDGTAAHPDAYHRDDFAVLPWQLDDSRFAVAFYVVTRNIVHEWDRSKDMLDKARYDMPDQAFDVTLSNVRGLKAKVLALDPLTGQKFAPVIVDATATSLTVRVQSTDYPRFLIIEELVPGPQIMVPSLTIQNDGSATVSVVFPQRVSGTLTWGAMPKRTGTGEIRFDASGAKSFKIAGLAVGEGVRITAGADDLVALWPRWDQDTAGVRWGPK